MGRDVLVARATGSGASGSGAQDQGGSGGRPRASMNDFIQQMSVLSVSSQIIRPPPSVYRCLKCSMSFTKFADLQDHDVMAHPTYKVMDCHVCGKTFARTEDLANHIAVRRCSLQGPLCY